MSLTCAYCGKSHGHPIGAVNRALAGGYRLFCDKKCSGLGRRKNKPKVQRVEEKRLYDIRYRARNAALLKEQKREYFKRTYDPTKAAIERKKNMARHVEYCRQPRYKQYKHAYDKVYVAKRNYGPFWECGLLALQIRREVLTRMTKHEVAAAKGTTNKSLKRRREYESLISNKS